MILFFYEIESMDHRDIKLRKMPPESIDIKSIQIPYMYIYEQFGFSVKSIYRQFMTQSDADLGTYPDIFPNNIHEHFWIQPGEAMVKSWISLGQLTNGLYFYYTAFSTNKDGQFYINTVKEEVAVPNLEPVYITRSFKPNILNFTLSDNFVFNTDHLPENPNVTIPIPINLESASISTMIITKSIKPIITGHMNLWLSCRISDIIEYSMDSVTYKKYMAETVPIE